MVDVEVDTLKHASSCSVDFINELHQYMRAALMATCSTTFDFSLLFQPGDFQMSQYFSDSRWA
jgi:hypothetical protein